MAGVVDARRDLVDQQPPVRRRSNSSIADHPDVVERREHRGGDPLGLAATAGGPRPARRCGAGCRPRGGSRPGDRRRCRRRGRARRSPTARARSRPSASSDRRPRADRLRRPPRRRPRCSTQAGPCRHSPRGGSSAARAADCASAAASSPAVVDAAKATVARRPIEEGLLVDAVLGDGQRLGGRGRHWAPSARAHSTRRAGTFSNSKVTTSADFGERRERLGVVVAPRSCARRRPRAAGAVGVGCRARQSKPSRAAASASMRPSWPPPRTPMVAPGGSGKPAIALIVLDRSRRRRRSASRARRRAARRAPASQSARIVAASSAGVLRARPRRWPASPPARRPASARWRAGESRPFRALDLDRHAEHRQRRSCEAVMPGRWAAPPAPAMITLKPAASRALGEGVQPLRRAVGRDDLGLVGDAQLVQHVGGVLQRRPVRPAAHDDGDGRGGAHFVTDPCYRRRHALAGRARSIGAAIAAATRMAKFA